MPSNKLTVSASHHLNQCDTFLLKIERMNDNDFSSDITFKFLHYDTVFSSVTFDKENGLNFGRYLFYAKKDTLSDALQVIYKGGDISVNLQLN